MDPWSDMALGPNGTGRAGLVFFICFLDFKTFICKSLPKNILDILLTHIMVLWLKVTKIFNFFLNI